ncbi:MAG: DUF5107 domain-containing protein [Planctomycetes bacterium]|nr:DUF5107 domain-containing protein [Planctomycetota bacterium]
MGYVRLEKDWRLHKCEVLRLESDVLRIDLLPELGGKIYHWVHKPTDRDFLWQHPRIPPKVMPAGTNYDDNFSGGWDELFPNGLAGQHDHEVYPDHGEYWTQPFDWEVRQSRAELTLHLRAEGCVTPTRMERWITLVASSPVVHMRYRLTHLGRQGFDYVWSIHPALAVGPQSELIIPAGKGVIGYPGLGRLADEVLEFNWPQVPGRDGKLFDMSRIPAGVDVPQFEMVYLTQLYEGWWAHLDHATGNGLGLAFDKQFFDTLWLFGTYGGWRGLHTVIPEAATGYPGDLATASTTGRCGHLTGGQVVETETAVVVFTAKDRIEHIGTDGTVR